jgi:hypothetical protein
MTSRPVALLLADLGIVKSHSRPHTSNDNPYSEAGFKTLEVPPRVPRSVRLDRRCPGLLPGLLRLVQHGAPPQRDCAVHPSRRPLRPVGRDARSPSRRPRRRLRDSPRALRQRVTAAQSRPRRGLDQPAAQGGAASLTSERRCLTRVDRFRDEAPRRRARIRSADGRRSDQSALLGSLRLLRRGPKPDRGNARRMIASLPDAGLKPGSSGRTWLEPTLGFEPRTCC